MIPKIKRPPIKIIIGLGNPGSAYRNTYHNVGFLFLDWLKEKTTKHNDLILLKSSLFMNQSGRAVKTALQRFKIKPVSLLVVHDDADIAFGEFKFSFGRNSAGHRGVESIIQNLKIKNFWRLRIGIRPLILKSSQATEVRQKRPKAGEFVLKNLTAAEQKILKNVFEKALPRMTTRIGILTEARALSNQLGLL